jgi:protein disulfide-isomerase A6
VLLITKDKKLPVLWQVLANKYRDHFEFASHRDRQGKGSRVLGIEEGGKKDSKVLVFPKGSKTFVRFEGASSPSIPRSHRPR